MALVYNERTGEFEDIRVLPQILDFKTQSQTIFEGDSFLVEWQVDNASIVEIDGERLQANVRQINLVCDFTGTKRISLIARNGADSVTRHLQVTAIPRPKFNLTCSNPKIRRNTQEKSIITWNIENAVSAQIMVGETTEDISMSGQKEIKPDAKTVVKFSAVSLDERTVFTEECVIEVFNASKVKFGCNKKFSFSGLPVVLSWETKDCLSVELDGFGPQPENGSITVSPEVTTDYVLKVTDSFGTEEYPIKVQMLPLPLIQSVLVEAPKLEHIVPISYNTPQFVTVPSIPKYENEFSRLEIPKIPDLKDSGYMVELPETPRKRLSQKLSEMFNHIF